MKFEVVQSEVSDGTMSLQSQSEEDYKTNRADFLQRHGISIGQTVLVGLRYEGDDYCRYFVVDKTFAGDGMTHPSTLVADALWTREKNLALFLPLADCIGAVLYDEEQEVLGLAHFGRHNLLQHGGERSIEFMTKEFGSKPKDITVYLSPAAGLANYPLYDFDGRSMHDVAREQLEVAGVPAPHITIDPEDTTKDEKFFSHSQFLKGKRATDGRHAIVARLRD